MNVDDVLAGMRIVYGPLDRGHGVEPSRLDRVEARLSQSLPHALRAWYQCVGAHPSQRVRNELRSPEDLGVDRDGMVFYRDPDAAVEWMVEVGGLSLPDPPVVERVGGVASPGVFPHMSAFFAYQCAWQAVDGGLPFVGVVLPPEMGAPEPLVDVRTLRVPALGKELVNGEPGLVRYCDGGIVIAGPDRYLGMAARDEPTFHQMSATIGMRAEWWDYSTYEEL